jgi:hypothetical protein
MLLLLVALVAFARKHAYSQILTGYHNHNRIYIGRDGQSVGLWSGAGFGKCQRRIGRSVRNERRNWFVAVHGAGSGGRVALQFQGGRVFIWHYLVGTCRGEETIRGLESRLVLRTGRPRRRTAYHPVQMAQGLVHAHDAMLGCGCGQPANVSRDCRPVGRIVGQGKGWQDPATVIAETGWYERSTLDVVLKGFKTKSKDRIIPLVVATALHYMLVAHFVIHTPALHKKDAALWVVLCISQLHGQR